MLLVCSYFDLLLFIFFLSSGGFNLSYFYFFFVVSMKFGFENFGSLVGF